MRYVCAGALLLSILPLSGCLVVMNTGDPFVDTETPEELDDGVPLGTNRIFVTSTSHNGVLGGKSGANAICSARAVDAGLTRNYEALIADQTTTVQSRFTAQLGKAVFKVDSTGNYVLVANTLSSMFLGTGSTTLLAPPDQTELKIQYTGQVWTGSLTTGTGAIHLGNNCTNWSTTGAASSFGIAGSTNQQWISHSGSTCGSTFRIYCLSND